MKWTKNATKINKKVEGEEERRGRGAERRGEERRARARTRKEKKGGPFWRRGDFWANQRWEGEVYPTLKGGTPSWQQPGELSGNQASSEPSFFDTNFRIDC